MKGHNVCYFASINRITELKKPPTTIKICSIDFKLCLKHLNESFCNLFSITAWSLECKDMTKDWVSSFKAFTAAALSCCLFIGLSAFSIYFNKWKEFPLGLDQLIDLATKAHPISVPLEDLGLLLPYDLGHYPSVLWSTILSIQWHLVELKQKI